MSDPLLDRIKAHRSAPDVYDPLRSTRWLTASGT
jgi:hypothetical protein